MKAWCGVIALLHDLVVLLFRYFIVKVVDDWSLFVALVFDFMLKSVTGLVTENKGVSEDIMKQAVDFIEKGFMDYVKNEINNNGKVGSVGSCCLFGIIWGRTLFVANVGDSRAILGSSKGFFKRPHVVQLTVDHHVSHAAAREEIRSHITNDPFVLCKNRGSLRVKSLIEV